MEKITPLVVCSLLLGSNVLAHTFINNLGSSACANTVNLWPTPGNAQYQITVSPGESVQVNGDYTTTPGLGIQVNNWYWTPNPLPVQALSTRNPQNPDNSGGQFMIDGDCNLSYAPSWEGDGISVWEIALVTATGSGDDCTITISDNEYTGAVTPGCCSPPGIGGGTCEQGTWGQTNNQMRWPPWN